MGIGVQDWVPNGFEFADPRAEPASTETDEWNALGPRIDLNEATFEQLREIGLSKTETMRLLAARERTIRFKSVSGAAREAGLTPSIAVQLRRACTV